MLICKVWTAHSTSFLCQSLLHVLFPITTRSCLWFYLTLVFCVPRCAAVCAVDAVLCHQGWGYCERIKSIVLLLSQLTPWKAPCSISLSLYCCSRLQQYILKKFILDTKLFSACTICDTTSNIHVIQEFNRTSTLSWSWTAPILTSQSTVKVTQLSTASALSSGWKDGRRAAWRRSVQDNQLMLSFYAFLELILNHKI